MENIQLSRFIKLILVAVFLLGTPFLPSSLKPSYVYVLLHLLIIVLGVDSGVLGIYAKPLNEKKPIRRYGPELMDWSHLKTKVCADSVHKSVDYREVEQPVVEKIIATDSVEKVKKCPSKPILFFIGEQEVEQRFEKEEQEQEEYENINGQELYVKAEKFIGNFYKELKLQRQESWNRIYGVL